MGARACKCKPLIRASKQSKDSKVLQSYTCAAYLDSLPIAARPGVHLASSIQDILSRLSFSGSDIWVMEDHTIWEAAV